MTKPVDESWAHMLPEEDYADLADEPDEVDDEPDEVDHEPDDASTDDDGDGTSTGGSEPQDDAPPR